MLTNVCGTAPRVVFLVDGLVNERVVEEAVGVVEKDLGGQGEDGEVEDGARQAGQLLRTDHTPPLLPPILHSRKGQDEQLVETHNLQQVHQLFPGYLE